MTFFNQGFSHIITALLRKSHKSCFPLISQISADCYCFICVDLRNLQEKILLMVCLSTIINLSILMSRLI